jgi:hypothetical protein
MQQHSFYFSSCLLFFGFAHAIYTRWMTDKLLGLVYAVLAFLLAAVLVLRVSASDGMDFGAVVHLLVVAWLVWLAARRWGWRRLAVRKVERAKTVVSSDTFPSRVVGVAMVNADGGKRQDIIKLFCKPGLELRLEREPENMHDGNAIAVWCAGGQIGYLTAELAKMYASEMDDGQTAMRVRVLAVTGGGKGRPSLGVNIQISLQDLEA